MKLPTRVGRVLQRAGATAFLLFCACTEQPGPVAGPASTTEAAHTVGSAACRSCHDFEFERWLGSHHQLAMQVADASTVSGDFGDVEFDYFGETSRFFRRDGRFVVATQGPHGEISEYPVEWVFGVFPLEQYLVEFPGGRLQALPFAWDTRPAADGGQRWFHLYPDDYIDPDDELHWTGPQQNWNYMCAECHSTNVELNYDIASDSFDTTFDEISVGCEACHGPGSTHVAQAESGTFANSRRGLVVDLDDHGRAAWIMNPDTGIAERSEPAMRIPQQPESCGRCHSRRGINSSEYAYGEPLADSHMPALLEAGLYFDDGQILDEVYVYGSFLQSRMYQAGVTCTDCHDPHAATLMTGNDSNAVCARCHSPERFAVVEHTGHAPADAGCVDCHMPARTYMVNDDRRDHSFRVPRPDLSVAIGTPNACNACHEDRSAAWASAAIVERYGPAVFDRPEFATAFHAARNGNGNEALTAAVLHPATPGIARATAIDELASPLRRADVEAIRGGLSDPDPLVRIAALRQLRGFPADYRLANGAGLLDDPVRSVRIEAALAYADIQAMLDGPAARAFGSAAAEYRDARLAIANRPEAHTGLGDFALAGGDLAAAAGHFRDALELDPRFTPARVNLADVLRRRGDDQAGRALLEEGIAQGPADAGLRHALGLLLVRSGDAPVGVESLRRAAELDPGNARYAYVAGVGLNSLGETAGAIAWLRDAWQRFPGSYDIGWALATVLRDSGDADAALQVADALLADFPDDQNVRALREQLARDQRP